MMGDMHRGLVSLDAPLIDVDAGFNSFGPYQQIPSLGIPCFSIPSMSWSSTDPALLSQLEQKPPSFSWQAESCQQQSLQYNAHASGYNSQVEMMTALNADPYSPSVNELSQMVQLYSSLYQDQFNPSFLDATSFPSEQQLPLIPSSSEVLQVVSFSGSHDSLSTSTETWRSDGSAQPNYDNVVLANLNDSPSVTLACDSLMDSWMNHNPLISDAAPSSSRPSFDVLPARSASDPLAFKRPRTWDEALQQGSGENSHLRYSLAAKTSLKLECSLGPRASPTFHGRLSRYSDNRFKPAATSVEPQSVAARHRRKKISERMRVLEKLIPGSNKMDTATMLDEAIEYVKFLQLQVQILENDSLDDIQPASNKRKTMEGGDLSATLSLVRPPATAPLVLSEVLQQQLFKQKLCLVSLRQCPPRTPPPSNVLRKN